MENIETNKNLIKINLTERHEEVPVVKDLSAEGSSFANEVEVIKVEPATEAELTSVAAVAEFYGNFAESIEGFQPKRKKARRSGAAKRKARKAKLAARASCAATPIQTPVNDWNVEIATGSESRQATPPSQVRQSNEIASARGIKRVRSEDRTSPEKNNEPKRANIFPEPTSYREALLNSRKVAIVPLGYPDDILTLGQGDLTLRALGAELDAIPEGVKVPCFDKQIQEQGILWITCSDDYSKYWLKDTVMNLEPWNGASLQAVEGELPPKLHKMIATVYGPLETTAVILTRLMRQNPGLRTHLWRVWVRKEADRSVQLVVGVDGDSLQVLREQRYMAHVGLGRVFFKDRHGRSELEHRAPTVGFANVEASTSAVPEDCSRTFDTKPVIVPELRLTAGTSSGPVGPGSARNVTVMHTSLGLSIRGYPAGRGRGGPTWKGG